MTGGSTGIGRAVVLRLAESGADVVFSYLSREEEARSLERECEGGESSVRAVRADVTDRSQIEHLVKEAAALTGEINVLVNNAGSMVRRKSLSEMDRDLWSHIVHLNLTSVFECTQFALPSMTDHARIVNIASLAAQNGGSAGAGAYAAAKGGVISLTRAFAKELADRRITVNAVAPGVITTPFQDRFTPREMREKLTSAVPLGREGGPGEVAGLVAYLASDWGAYVTGQVIAQNGGIYMG